MSELDLDITHYDVSDLESFFNLPGKPTYTVSEIDAKVSQIKELLFSTGHIAKHLKRDLIEFLQQGRNLKSLNKDNYKWWHELRVYRIDFD